MALSATASEPTGYGAMGASGNDTWFDGKVFSYAVSSAVSISKGDFVMLVSTLTNAITTCSSSVNDTQFLGVAVTNLDNSAGTVASDTKVGVLREGIAMVNILVGSTSEDQDDIVYYDDLLYLAATQDGITPAPTGQALVSTDNGIPVARSMDYITVPTTASTLFRGRVYIDTLSKSLMAI